LCFSQGKWHRHGGCEEYKEWHQKNTAFCHKVICE
jgi:hypothetical protein